MFVYFNNIYFIDKQIHFHKENTNHLLFSFCIYEHEKERKNVIHIQIHTHASLQYSKAQHST